VDELVAAGIAPFPTLYHWDLSQALQDKGGWQSRDTAKAFGDYAGYMAEKLSDRVRYFFTLNEFRNCTDTGYRGLEVKVGGGVVRLENAPFLTVMLEGKYTDAYLKGAGSAAPKFTPEELKIIAEPIDFVGINVYKPGMYVLASDKDPGYREVPYNKSHPKMFSSWHVFGPEALYWGPKFVQSLWKAKAIYITENGCAAADELAEDGNVYDTDRIMFLRAYLRQLQRATADGVPVKGYFLWSTMDNFEWINGYGDRFGLVYAAFTTQKRTPKLSAAWFRKAAARNAVV